MSALTIDIADGVARLTLNRPAAANALDLGLAAALLGAFETIETRAEVRCVLLRAEGRLFCGGGDLRSMAGEDNGPRVRALADALHLAVEAIDASTKPLVVAVQGAAAGAGVALAALGDIVLASERARFAPAYGRIGLTPDGGSTWVLPRVMGERRATEFLLSGRVIDAAEAAAAGLVTRCVPHDALAGEAEALATSLAAQPNGAAGGARRLIRDGRRASLRDHLVAEAESVAAAAVSPEARASIHAFLNPVREGA